MILRVALLPLLWIIFFVPSYCQSTNEEVFIQLIDEFQIEKDLDIGTLAGFSIPSVDSIFSVDSTFSGTLTISEPDIQFKRIKKGMYSRFIGVGIAFADSTKEDFFLEHADTIQRNQIKMIRKSSYKPLRGESPLAFQTVVLPILGIGTGISVFLILFNVRS